MKLGLRLLLVLSLAVNVGLVGVGIYRAAADSRDWGAAVPPDAPPPPAPDTWTESGPEPVPSTPQPVWVHGGRMRQGAGGRALQHWSQRRVGRLDRALHLTREQHRQMEEQLRPLHGDIQSLSAQLARARGLLMAQLAADRVDAGAARGLQARISRAQARLDSLVTEAMLREHDVLDPRQRLIHSRMLRAVVAQRSAAAPPFDSPAPMDTGNKHDDEEDRR